MGEWEQAPLGRKVEFLSGGTPTKSDPSYWDGEIPWVSAKDMKRFRLKDTEDHVTEEGARSGTRVVGAGTTLLLVRGMTLHKDLPICVVERPTAFNQDVKAVRPREGVRADYVPYLLLGNKQRLLDRVDSAGHGTGRLNADVLETLVVAVPSEPEQRGIAEILSALDDKIELNGRASETLGTIAQALFQSWFVDFAPVRAKAEGRDPGSPRRLFDLFPDSFDHSDLGEIPSGWELRGLDTVARFLNGLALQKFPVIDGRGLPVIKIAQLRSGTTRGADVASADIDRDYIVEDGDVLFSWSGSLECAVWSGGRGALNQHLFKVTSSDFPKWFYFLWIHQHLDEFRHIAAGKATTMGHIQRHHLSEAKVVVPPAPVVEGVDRFIAPLIDRIAVLASESRTLKSLRDTLLPKLISGELRIEHTELLPPGGE